MNLDIATTFLNIINITLFILTIFNLFLFAKFFSKKKMLSIVLLIIAITFGILFYQISLFNLSFKAITLNEQRKYEESARLNKIGAALSVNPKLKTMFYGDVGLAYFNLNNQGKSAIYYFDKAYSISNSYKPLYTNEVWPKWINSYFFNGSEEDLASPWSLFASLIYLWDNQFDKAEKVWRTTGENTEWAGFSTSIIKKDYKNALINANKMVEAKYTPNSLAQRANLHKEMGNFTAYNDDKKEAEKLCNNDTKCLDNVRKLSENYIKEQFEVYHYNRKRLGFE